MPKRESGGFMGRDYEERCALSVLRGGGGNGSNSAVPNPPAFYCSPALLHDLTLWLWVLCVCTVH